MDTALCVPDWIAPKKLEALLRQTPTPLFVYDEKSLVQSARALFDAFSWNGAFLPRFPVRMNPNPALLGILRSCGCGVLCRSLRELELAAQCGFLGQQVAYEPARADPEAEQAACRLHAVFVLDGGYVLPGHVPERVTLLLRQHGALRTQAGQAICGMGTSYAGMEREELIRMARTLRAHGVQSIGLGMRLGDLCMDSGFYPAVFGQLSGLAVQLLQQDGLRVDAFDLGGGLGVSYRANYTEPGADACAAQLMEQMHALPQPLRDAAVQMSPGRFLAAHCGILVTRVTAVKSGTPPVAVLDVSPAQCLRLTKKGAYHPVTALRTAGRPMLPQLLTGSVETGAALSRTLPELRAGDPVIIGMLGADGRSLCSQYGGLAPCEEYLLRADGTMQRITAC